MMGQLAAMPGMDDWMLPPQGPRGELAPNTLPAAFRMGGLAAMEDYRQARPNAWSDEDRRRREAEPLIPRETVNPATLDPVIQRQMFQQDQARRQASFNPRSSYAPPPRGQLSPPGSVDRQLGEYGREVADLTVPQSPEDLALMGVLGPFARPVRIAAGAAGALGQVVNPSEAKTKPKMGGLFDAAALSPSGPSTSLEFWRLGDTKTLPRAGPEAINRAAAESAKGMSGPQLLDLYNELGLTGRGPSEFASTSLAAKHGDNMRQNAISLKLADREVINKLTPEQRATYRTTQNLPEGMELPSQLAAPNRDEWDRIKKEVTKAENIFDANALAGIKPSIFDLSPKTLMQTPDVPQFNLPRIAPEQTKRLAPVSRGGVQRLERAAGNAPPENWGWYNLMQTRDLMHSIHGPQKGEQVWQDWVSNVAGTSMVNPIDSNIRSSTWYLQQLLHGNPLPERLKLKDPTGQTVQTLVGPPDAGYGAKAQIQHAVRVREFLENLYDPVKNPKPISYRTNLSGNWMPRTVDTHDIRNMVGMPYGLTMGENAGLLPKEYSYLEGIGQRATDRARLPNGNPATQAGQQAVTWIGGGKYTGLKSYPAPFVEALNRRAQVTAQVRGISPEQAMTEAFSGKRPLLGIGGAAGGAALGAGAMGDTVDQSNYH